MTYETPALKLVTERHFDIKRMRLLTPSLIGITKNMRGPLTEDDRLADWLSDRGSASRVYRSRRPGRAGAYSDYVVEVSPPLSPETFTALGRAVVAGELVPDWAVDKIDAPTQGVEAINNIGWLPESPGDNGSSVSNYAGEVVASSLRPLPELTVQESEVHAETDQLRIA